MDAIAVTDFAAIERRRVQLGISQAELCRRAGINAVTYSRLKSAENKARVTTLRALADVLDVVGRERVIRLNARAEA